MKLLFAFIFAGLVMGQCICPIKLPVEVVGADGTSVAVSFDVPSALDTSLPLTLSLQVHNLKYPQEASVRINSYAWIPLDNSVTLQGLAGAYGGIGGGFSTIKMTLPIPAGIVRPGPGNVISFRFNGTDGRTSGFRVLAFNFEPSAAGASNLIDASRFMWDDPTAWQPPLTSASDISAGKTLFQTAVLQKSSMTGPSVTLRSHCSSCHAQDGRDLKYFNYSNTSIRARAIFHGLTAQQGDQIASYVRSLQTPAPGRPWNPPYQPGPGLDSAPASQWAAGAGLNAVLNRDVDTLADLAPNGDTSKWAAGANLSPRETRIAIQLPDWNTWLPQVGPLDGWPDFEGSKFNADYTVLRAMLAPGSSAAYLAAAPQFDAWHGDDMFFITPKMSFAASDPIWTADYVARLYSLQQWMLVKNWELMQEFQLEDSGKVIYGPTGDSRAWPTATAFNTSPNLLHIPIGAPGIQNGLPITWEYTAYVWYHEQLILNNSYHRSPARPIDWPYAASFAQQLGLKSKTGTGSLLLLWLIKGLQTLEFDGGPQLGTTGWHRQIANINSLVYPAFSPIWSQYSQAQRAFALQSYLQSWLTKVKTFTPSQWYAGGWATAGELVSGKSFDADFGNDTYADIPQFLYFGVDRSLVQNLDSWAQTVWTGTNWAPAMTMTCAVGSNGLVACQ